MIENLIISLILTLVIELFMSILIGLRKRNDIITVIFVNTLTNPIVVFIANIIKIAYIYWLIVIIMEFIVILIEGKIYDKILIFKNISGIKISCLNNIISFGIGLIITIVAN